MEKIDHKKNEKSTLKYTSVVKSALILLILLWNPHGFSMNSEKESIFLNEWSIDSQTNKQLIEDAIRKILHNLPSLNKLPQPIVYPNKNIKNVPQKIDINPKEIREPVEWISLTLWERTFYIEPLLGKILSVKLEEQWKEENNKKVKYKVLKIETTYLDIEYSDKRMWEICNRLWNTTKGEWKKSWFIGTTITEEI